MFYVLSQILGLDGDKSVKEVMVGNLWLVSESKKEFCLKYDEFVVERISSQLDNFHSLGKIFTYQTLLMLIVINDNLQTLHQTEPGFFANNVNLSEKNASMTFFNFTHKIIVVVYKLISGTTLPRLMEEMKVCLHNHNEPVGDYFLY